jgi:hypothetical protein
MTTMADLLSVHTQQSQMSSFFIDKVKIISVLSYGAEGDNTTDDTTAINNAITAIASLATDNYHPVLFFPSAAGYKTTDTITVPKNISVVMEAPIVYAGTSNEAALVVGAASEYNLGVNLKLNVQRNTTADWTSEDSIGIKIFNANACNIEIVQAKGYTLGLQCIGDGQGFAYNAISLFEISDNKIGLDLNSANSGWCNENLFTNGKFTVYTGVNSSLARYGIRITSTTSYYNNNNYFIKPSFELNSTDSSGEAVPILIEYGEQNEFISCRNEINDTPFARITNASKENVFDLGYGLYGSIDDQSTYPTSIIRDRRTKIRTEANNCIFISGALHKKACYSDGNTSTNIPGVHISGSGSGAAVFNAASAITMNAGNLQMDGSRGVAVFVDTSVYKRFVIRKDVDSGFGGRIKIRCYDASDVVLTSAGAGHPYVKTSALATVAWDANFGGVYSAGSDSESDFYFTVDDDVKKIAVILSGGTANLKVRSFSIFTVDEGNCAVWAGYEEIIPGANIGTAAPTAGTWAVGRRVINAVPAVGQPKAWICTVAGTPGTWVSEGNL